eukprot:6625478-Pyramimonas_sp.AAC.1
MIDHELFCRQGHPVHPVEIDSVLGLLCLFGHCDFDQVATNLRDGESTQGRVLCPLGVLRSGRPVQRILQGQLR